MTCEESIKWLENLKSDLGESQFSELWHYEQALDETIELLQSDRLVELPCKVGDNFFIIAQRFEKGKYTDFFIDKKQVTHFEYNGKILMIYDFEGVSYVYDFEEMGFVLDSIYFDKSKAEAKLKELKK